MSQPKRGRSSQAQNHLITILLALVIAGLSMWFGAGRDGGNGPDAAATPVPGSGLTVTYLDVGQGDCTLLQCDGQTMLIDAGIGEQANHITTYLKQQGVKSIDYLVCTHAHADHCGGMKAVIAAFPVHTFYSSVTSSSNGAFQRVMRAAETANLAITVPGVGDTFALGGATVTVLGPQKHYSDVNDQSLILRVDYGSNAFLFTGDARGEKRKAPDEVCERGEPERGRRRGGAVHGCYPSFSVVKVRFVPSERQTTVPLRSVR